MFNNTVVMYTIVMHKYTVHNIARSDVWWNNVVMRTFTHQDWLQNLECVKRPFYILFATAYHRSWRREIQSCGDHCLYKGEWLFVCGAWLLQLSTAP